MDIKKYKSIIIDLVIILFIAILILITYFLLSGI